MSFFYHSVFVCKYIFNYIKYFIIMLKYINCFFFSNLMDLIIMNEQYYIT